MESEQKIKTAGEKKSVVGATLARTGAGDAVFHASYMVCLPAGSLDDKLLDDFMKNLRDAVVQSARGEGIWSDAPVTSGGSNGDDNAE